MLVGSDLAGDERGCEEHAADARGGMMHVKMPNALLPRISLPPDSPLALKNSRHPINEAGLESIVAGLQATVTAHATGSAAPGDRLSYEGLVAPAPDLPPGFRRGRRRRRREMTDQRAGCCWPAADACRDSPT